MTISSGLSGTYNVVRLLGEQTEGLDVFVLDTKNIGIGAGIQAIRAAELIETGLDGKNYNKINRRSSQRKSIF